HGYDVSSLMDTAYSSSE
ncbi:hypothetical protein Tco_0638653, partial [Tanacetum coccineum]